MVLLARRGRSRRAGVSVPFRGFEGCNLVGLEAYFKAHPGAGEAAIVLARNGAVQSVTWGGKRYVPRTEVYVVSEFLARIKLVPGRKQP